MLHELVQVNVLVIVAIHVLKECFYYMVKACLKLYHLAAINFTVLNRLLYQKVLQLLHRKNPITICISFLKVVLELLLHYPKFPFNFNCLRGLLNE